jgi:hypothetical protein
MDAGLALHMKSLGYDPVTGELARPEALPEQPIAGCGGACGGHGHGERAAETPPAQAEATAHA